MVAVQSLVWNKENDTYLAETLNLGTRPLFALGPIQSRYAGSDSANASWLRERWVLFNGPGEPEVTSFAPKKNSPLDKTSTTAEDSDQTIVMDLDGVMREFTLSGVFGGSTEAINVFVGKVNMLLSGAQIDEEALRFIQRYSNHIPARLVWSAASHSWGLGDSVGTSYPTDWAGDATCGLNVGVVLESFDWDYTNEQHDEISFTLTFTEGVTY